DMMGFIFYPPSSRYVAEKPDFLPQKAKRVGVFVDAPTDFIYIRAKNFNLNLLQLHGNESPDCCAKLKTLLPHIKIIKTFSIASREDLEKTHNFKAVADYFLFDTPTKLKGGSGQTFNHKLLEQYEGETPFLLSGGLSLENQEETLRIKHPMLAGYDLNSRFETQPALKDPLKIKLYINRIKQTTI
ncbi:MAG: phosphoribosylanthranilate isomerase, partial [Bacteroidaceae bacterium]|nr:phosphoribosylanthranilate isomerase [Bacteroidaceae bacterium]